MTALIPRDLDIIGIGNAILDKLIKVSDLELEELHLQRGGMTLVSAERQQEILAALGPRRTDIAPGGSAANTIVGLQQLGGRAGFIGALGPDPDGRDYAAGFAEAGIELAAATLPGATGTSLILITPDGERTMNTHLGVAAQLAARHVDPEWVARARWLYIEGYLLTSESAAEAAFVAMDAARRHGTRIAISFSDGFVVEHAGNALREAVREYADLIFANEREAAVYAGVRDPEAACRKILGDVDYAIVTRGANGSLIGRPEGIDPIPAHPATPLDLTGAGDLYAAGVLYGITHGWPWQHAGRLGARAAHEVILQIGPRVPGNLRHLVAAEAPL